MRRKNVLMIVPKNKTWEYIKIVVTKILIYVYQKEKVAIMLVIWILIMHYIQIIVVLQINV